MSGEERNESEKSVNDLGFKRFAFEHGVTWFPEHPVDLDAVQETACDECSLCGVVALPCESVPRCQSCEFQGVRGCEDQTSGEGQAVCHC